MTLYFAVSGCSAVALHSKIAMVAMENKEIFISRVGRSGRAAAAVVYSWGRGRGPLGAADSTRSGAGSPRAPKHGSEPLPLSEGFARASTLVLKLCWPSGVAAWGGLCWYNPWSPFSSALWSCHLLRSKTEGQKSLQRFPLNPRCIFCQALHL